MDSQTFEHYNLSCKHLGLLAAHFPRPQSQNHTDFEGMYPFVRQLKIDLNALVVGFRSQGLL